MFIFISESEQTLFQVGSLKNPTFQVCDYTINTLNVKIEQHMAKKIKGINQLNGMTQTDMIRQICILQRGVQGHGKRTSPKENTESQTSKNNCCGWKSLLGHHQEWDVWDAQNFQGKQKWFTFGCLPSL